jgi:tripartite-type tricarboxylate transporter receptor subunit TctC
MRKTLLSVFLTLAGVVPVLAADPIEDFYKGKNVYLQVGSDAGGGYDLYGRAVARHLSRHIPGKPTIVVQNVPGGGSLALANQFANTTPKDGTYIGLFAMGMPTTPLLFPESARFDPRQFNFIGSPARETQVFGVWHTAPATTLEELYTKEIIVGAAAPGSTTLDYPLVLNAVLGTKLKIVGGYLGGPDTKLAMERGEIHSPTAIAWVTAKTVWGDLLRSKQMLLLGQFGFRIHPELKDLPQVPLGKTESDRQIFHLLYSRQDYGRPLALPPGVVAERIKAMRQAFNDTVNDPDFLADADKAKLEISLVTGEELQTLTDNLYKTPPEVVDRMRVALKTKVPEKQK